MENDGVLAMGYKEFAKRHGISLSFLYQLLSTGKGPATIRIGKRRLVSAEAAKAWRQRFEQQAA